jgi:predicted transcriptional regulator
MRRPPFDRRFRIASAFERLDAETSAAIDEGLAQARRGEFVPDEVVTEANERHGI